MLNYEQGVESFRVTDSLSDSERCHADGRRPDEYLQLVAGHWLTRVGKSPFPLDGEG